MPGVLYIGDDFTGASDSMATYARFGWRTSLLLDTDLAVSSAASIDALGIPTDLRSLGPGKACREIARLWPTINAVNPQIIHYKVCSTFDSSPDTGSIGASVSEITDRFSPDVVAVVGGQPSLRRYSAFGNLFAAALDGCIYRIDRHPVMRAHPVTPMTEGNLVTHLAAQGLNDLQLASLPDLSNTESLVAKLRNGPVYFDAASDEDLQYIARSLEEVGGRQLLVGASSVAEILAKGRSKTGSVATVSRPISDRLFVFAGSRSSSTRAQIDAATTYGIVELDPETLQNGAGLAEAVDLLKEGRAVLAHLVPGADYGDSPSGLANLSVAFVSSVIDRIDVGYLGLAGGDTSSRICSSLGFSALDFWQQIEPGVCVCTSRHASPKLRNMCVMLKGGQMGGIEVFDSFAAVRSAGRGT